MANKISNINVTNKTYYSEKKDHETNVTLDPDSFNPIVQKAIHKFSVIPARKFRHEIKEAQFMAEPTYDNYIKLARRFQHTFKELGHNNYEGLCDILIKPKKNQRRKSKNLDKKEKKLSHWHEKAEKKLLKEGSKAGVKRHRRQTKINTHGPGFFGPSSKMIYNSKMTGRYTKDFLTLRGWVFRSSDTICGKSLYELLPRYGFRNGGYIGIRVAEFTINTVFLAVGYGLMPVSYGTSKIVSDHLRTVVTVAGEAIGYGILGAQGRKIIMHSATRAVQLEIPKFIPGGGDFFQYGEMGAQSLGNGIIALSYMADMVMKRLSTRYTSLLTKRELGDSRVLYEIDQRIDYLSRFLIPYGQWLLMQEKDSDHQHRLKKRLKRQGKILRNLEKKRVKTIHFYQVAILGGRIPEKYREKIMQDTLIAALNPRKNCQRTARQCLARLRANKL